jgi:uncharacterized protein YcnI
VTRARRIALAISGRAAVVGIVVLGARSISYALAEPSPIGGRLEHSAGEPGLVVLALTTIGLAAVLAAALVWTVAVGISERIRVGPPLAEALPPVSGSSVVARSAALWVASCLAFTVLESYVHWRAGLGWHGTHCLIGPVHRNAVPILAGLSLLASALVTAGSHLMAWLRRVVARLCSRLARLRRPTALRWARDVSWPRPTLVEPGRSPRAPPARVSVAAGHAYVASGQPANWRLEQMKHRRSGRTAIAFVIAGAAALVAASGVSAHAEISPAVAKAKTGQVFTLAVPTEEEGATTTTIELTPPQGFAIDSFAPSPGWKRKVQSTGSGEESVVQKVTWSGGAVPTGEDAVFQFLASPTGSGTYTFNVRQTYSDGKVVDWAGAESSDTPAPRIESVSSLGGGGGGSSVLSIVALIVAALALLVGVFALIGERRPLA